MKTILLVLVMVTASGLLSSCSTGGGWNDDGCCGCNDYTGNWY